MNKVTIIGTGSVGSTIAYTLTVMGIVSEIVMIDVNEEKSLGEALDIRQGVPFCNPCSVYAGSYANAKDSDIVIITSGVARKPGQSRLDLAQTNVNILKTVANEIVKYALSEEFEPKNTIDGDDLHALINRDEITVVANPNAAFNPNDKTAVRNKK